jgi:hypothetical protein
LREERSALELEEKNNHLKLKTFDMFSASPSDFEKNKKIFFFNNNNNNNNNFGKKAFKDALLEGFYFCYNYFLLYFFFL